MNPINLTELIPRCHEAAKANGWWEPKPNAGQQLMLVVSELAEALEADRTGKTARWADYTEKCGLWSDDFLSKQSVWQNMQFKSYIKDSVGDELADAYIRLCDYAGGFEVAPSDWIASYTADLRHRIKPAYVAANFGEALLRITVGVVAIEGDFQPTSLCASLARIEALCAREGIDLATHIDLKLQYNASRGHKHGGKAY